MEKDKILRSDDLDKVAGGSGSGYPSCPKCGSSDVELDYEHDEVGVFDCRKCGHHFTKRYGE